MSTKLLLWGVCDRISKALSLALIGVLSLHCDPARATQTLNWGTCPPPQNPALPSAGMQCATLTVPLDYHSPSGQTLTIEVSRVQAAQPSLRRGVLIVNTGGPGNPQIDAPRLMAAAAPASLLAVYDIVSFDPRGTNLSTPVSCGLTAQQADQTYVTLGQPGGFTATQTFAQFVANSCAANAGSYVPYITTANIARDMDQIRQALGEAKISYLGYSWGTSIGVAYDTLFPGVLDRVVLDSTLNTAWEWRQAYREFGAGGAVRFPDFASYAAANNATYGLGATPAAVTTTYNNLISSLAATPQSFPALYPDGTLVNDSLFRELTFLELYSDNNFPALAGLWQILLNGTASQTQPPPPVQSSVPVDNKAAMGIALSCDDAAWSNNPAQYQAELTQDIQNYPLFGALASQIWPCAFWPNQPIESVKQPSSNGLANILMVSNIRDPAGVYSGAQAMRAAYGLRAILVSVNQGGHDVYLFTNNTCANNSVTAYLVGGGKAGSDFTCP